MSYLRVIPRDLFNESKLLKCLGQLSLFAHNYPAHALKLEHLDEDEGFRVEQNESSGALYCTNLELFVAGQQISLSSPYNSKDAYPLRFVLNDDNEGRVFNEDGTLSDDFRNIIASTK